MAKLELVKIPQFELEHDGEHFTITSDLMSRTGEWILRYATSQDTIAPSRRPTLKANLQSLPITFTESDLVRLDGWEAKRRQEQLEIQPPTKLSHLLRIVGAHLDKNAARSFTLYWAPDFAVVDYRRAGGYTDRLRFSRTTIGQTVGGGFHRVVTALPKR